MWYRIPNENMKEEKTMNMRKIIAIAAAVLMLVSILPISAMAATEIVFELGDDGNASHADGSSTTSYTDTVNGYTLNITNGTNFYTKARDAKGNGCIKLGTSSKAGSFTITVPADVSSVVIAVAAYKSKTATMDVNGTKTTLTTKSDNGQYDNITVDTTATKSISVKVSSGYRAMVNSITFVVGGGDEPVCEHVYDNDCDVNCNECGTVREIEHAYESEVITEATCENVGEMKYTCSVCGDNYDEDIPLADHNYVDGSCDVCGAEEPNIAEYTITFDANKTQRTEYSSSKQVWQNGALTFTNNKANSSTAVGDYGGPVRVYSGSEIVVECIGMTQIVFDCNSTTYANTLKSSIGSAATVSSDKVTVAVSENTFSFTLSGQVRIDSITVTAEVQDAETCEHENAKECDAYCPDCGDLISEGATHVSDAQYPCYAGTCIHCGKAIEAVDHILDENDVCTVCGLAPTPENPVDPENPQEYVFKNFAAGTQYAVNEKHFLDNAVTVITNQAHFTEQLRIYSSETNNSTVIIKSKKDISAIVLNAGNKKDTLNVYVSEDGAVYEAIEITSTSYNDYTLLIPEMTKYIMLDVAGDQQVRIAKMTLYFDGEVPHVCEFVGAETLAPTCGLPGVMTYSCTCGEGTYTEEIPATGEHTYDDEYDADCNGCGAIREVEAPVACNGTSVSEDVEGLAFRFTVDAQIAIAFERITEIDYANSVFGEYKLNGMGALMSNGFQEIDIPAVYAWNYTETSVSYAVRILELDEDFKKECTITAKPYIVIEKDGVEITVYGEVQSATYNGVLNG